MSSAMPFTFNAVDLCVVTIDEKPWTLAREVCRALEYSTATKAADVVRHLCSKTNYAHKWQLTRLVSKTKPVEWSIDSQKYYICTDEEGMYEIVFSSQQPKKKNSEGTVVMCCFLISTVVYKKMNEDHQQAIEVKDAAIALLNDDLQKHEYENVALQAQTDVHQAELQKCQDTITHLKTRYVPHAKKSRQRQHYHHCRETYSACQ